MRTFVCLALVVVANTWDQEHEGKLGVLPWPLGVFLTCGFAMAVVQDVKELMW